MKASIVTKFLGSVKKICQASHTVVFDDEGSFIVKEHWRDHWRGQLAERRGWKLHVGRVVTKLQIQTQQGPCGRRGRRDQEDMAPEARPRGEPSTSSETPLTVARDPGDPRTKEREDHNATHIPFRSWCPICVKAKGREEAHRNGTGKERGRKATISFDYKTFGQEDDRDNKATCTKTITPE